MTIDPDDVGNLLRARGLRSTPQRRTILSIFRGGRTEHFSADEVYAQASRSLPDLGRGTVYAILAEFSDLGLLSAFGSAEPVRYEINVDPHAHFRCDLCLRVFDLSDSEGGSASFSAPGFTVKRVETRAEGTCDECASYAIGLIAGARSIIESGPPTDALSPAGVAVSATASPLGRLLLAATPFGLTRLAFEDHGDADALQAHASSRRGRQAARRHLAEAAASLERYFSGELPRPVCAIDWTQLGSLATALMSTEAIPYATRRSYSELEQNLSAHSLGLLLGANPIPIFTPCHRVTRGTEIPTTFVGGASRRQWLVSHERAFPRV